MAGRTVQTGPMKDTAARQMRTTAATLDESHPEMVTSGHVRDAAKVLQHGSTDGAKRHLDAAMETLTPRNLIRHGVTDDEGHAHAKHLMHQINRHRLAVMDIEDAQAKNQQAQQAKQATAQQALQARQVATSKQLQRSAQRANDAPGGQDPSLFSTPIEMSARTAMLTRTPAPRGRPGGPGLYDVKGLGHSAYFQQVVKALIEKRGMPPEKAYPIAYAALRKWRAGGGHTHPEVQAAAAGSLASEAVKGAAARASHGHAAVYSSWQAIDLAVELAATAGNKGAGQHPKSQAKSQNAENEARVPKGQFGGGRFGSGGGAAKGKQGKPHNAAQRAQRKQQLERQASSLRAQISALVKAYRAATAHHKASQKASSKTASQTSAQAAQAAKSQTAAKSASSTPAKKGATAKTAKAMTPSAMHSKIIALRAVLAGVMSQIHALANDMPAIELAAWQHELRGKGGRFARTPGMGGGAQFQHGGTSHPEGGATGRGKLLTTGIPLTPEFAPAPGKFNRSMLAHKSEPPLEEVAHEALENSSRQAVATAVAAVRKENREQLAALERQHDADMRKVLGMIHDTNQRMTAAEEKQEGHKAVEKLAIEGGVLAAGGVLAYLEAHFGVPDLAALGTALVGPAVQIVSEWRKRL